MKLKNTLILCIFLLFYSCTNKVKDPCEVPYPCPPLSIIYPFVNFQLTYSNGVIIDIKPNDIGSIILSSDWHINDFINIDTTNEIINVEFNGLIPKSQLLKAKAFCVVERLVFQSPLQTLYSISCSNVELNFDAMFKVLNKFIVSHIQ